jgi:hypothetical protein
VGASLAFSAGLEKYRREDYVLLSYHVHIPLPDPMVNPAALARQKFYDVNSSPTYVVDGERSGGGGSADGARSLFESKIDPMVVKHLAEAPEAALKLTAKQAAGTIKVKTSVSKVTRKSDKLRLHVALVEDTVRYNGENGLRFHDMVVRAMAESPPAARAPKPAVARPDAAKPASGSADTPNADVGQPDARAETVSAKTLGFTVKPGQGGTFEYTFDLKKAEAEALAHLQDFETNTRKGQYSFRQKKHEIDSARLSVVAFVQDEATKKILQTIYVKLPGAKLGN